MCKMSVSSSTIRWPAQLRPMFIVSVRRVSAFGLLAVTYLLTAPFLPGRTGRPGKLGTAITFLTNDDDEVMYVFILYPVLSSYQMAHMVLFRFRYDLKQGMFLKELPRPFHDLPLIFLVVLEQKYPKAPCRRCLRSWPSTKPHNTKYLGR